MAAAKPRTAYVDVFVIPIPTKNIEAYTKIAKKAAKVWMEHGAVTYHESVGEDLEHGFGRLFPKLAKVVLLLGFCIFLFALHIYQYSADDAAE